MAVQTAPPRSTVAPAGSVRPAVPAPALALGSMVLVQVGAAASTPLFDRVGSAGTAWLRLTWAALFFLVLVRPSLRTMPRATLRSGLALGAATAGMTVTFFAAIERIPLGTATALEFLGPLAVAVAHRSSRSGLVWPALAGVGVLALTEPWSGEVDGLGVLLALCAAVCWGAYIVLTQRVGDALSGMQGLALSMPAAALFAGVFGAPQALPALSLEVLVLSAGLALLLPIAPYALEMLALRRLTTASFGTLMSLEPAIALAVGLVLLAQQPAPSQAVGVALVVLAGIGAARDGRRPALTTPEAGRSAP